MFPDTFMVLLAVLAAITASHLLHALLVALQLADLWSTHQNFKLGGREANSLLRRLFGRFDALAILWLKVLFVAAVGWWIRESPATLAAFDLGYALLVFWNFGLLRNRQGRDWWGRAAHEAMRGLVRRMKA